MSPTPEIVDDRGALKSVCRKFLKRDLGLSTSQATELATQLFDYLDHLIEENEQKTDGSEPTPTPSPTLAELMYEMMGQWWQIRERDPDATIDIGSLTPDYTSGFYNEYLEAKVANMTDFLSSIEVNDSEEQCRNPGCTVRVYDPETKEYKEKKCNMYYTTMQTRSGDEPATVWYICPKCHRKRRGN